MIFSSLIGTKINVILILPFQGKNNLPIQNFLMYGCFHCNSSIMALHCSIICSGQYLDLVSEFT